MINCPGLTNLLSRWSEGQRVNRCPVSNTLASVRDNPDNTMVISSGFKNQKGISLKIIFSWFGQYLGVRLGVTCSKAPLA